MAKLDGFDLKILRILQDDNTISQQTISEMVSLSPAAVHRRVQKIKSLGIIKSNNAVLDPSKLGSYISILVEVELENEKSEYLEQAKKLFLSFEEIQQCYYVTGEADFILIISALSMQHYERLTKKVFFNNKNVKRFRTSVVMENIKASLKLKLEE